MSKKTTVIIGAGASAEAKLPTGDKLKKKIARFLDIKFEHGHLKKGDGHILDAIAYHMQEQVEQDRNPYLSAMRHICDAMPLAISIDHFIDMHAGNKNIELCGKLAIVRSILEAEQNSLIYPLKEDRSQQPDYSQIEQTWFNCFFQKLTENCRFEDLPARFSSITLIIFNYDRCIEEYLYRALKTTYGIHQNDASKLIELLQIYHPYGVVGDLPWQKGNFNVGVGDDLYPKTLLDIARQIKTFTEGTNPKSSDVKNIRDSIYDAQTVLFLGFAFHELNM